MKLSLSNISLPADSLTWALRTGLQPHIARISVPLPIHTKLLQLASPTTLILDTTHCDGARLEFHGVHLAGFSRAAGGADFRWQLADARIAWRGHRISGRYNIPGELNDAELDDATTTTTATTAEPQFATARFLSATLNPATQTPWTALQLATHLLQRLDGGAAFVATHELDDNGVVAPALDLRDADPLRVLPALLEEADVEVAALADGTLRLVPHAADLAPYAPPRMFLAAENAGAARVDAVALRPREVRVRVPREVQREFRFVAGDETTITTDDDAGRLINVLRLPRDESLRAWSETSARTWPAGSFVPVDDALAAWGLTDRVAREKWFVGGLEREFAAGGTGGEEADGGAWSAEWLQRISAIREHWRKTFAIDPDHLAQLAAWRPSRIDVPDRQTKRAARAMAFAPHTVIPPVRPPAKVLAGLGSGDRAHAAARRIVVATSDVPFGEVEVLDAAAGIFRVCCGARVPGTVRDATIPPATIDGAGATWADAEIDDAWELRVPLAVMPADDRERWHELTLPAAELGAATAAGPAVRVDELEEPLRVRGNVLLNLRTILAIARRAGRRVMRLHRARWRGQLVYEGLHELPPPCADVRRVAWRVEPDGRCTTEVSLAE